MSADEYKRPSELANAIREKLRAKHKPCNPESQRGACHLADLHAEDIQEILNLAGALMDKAGPRRFVSAHPKAQYAVLRIDDPAQIADLINDLQEWPNNDLLTPTMENHVSAVPVAVLDEWPPS